LANLFETQADKLGEKLRAALRDVQKDAPFVQIIRGRGLLNAVVIDEKWDKTAWDICMLLKHRGVLAKPTHNNIIRFVRDLLEAMQFGGCVFIIGVYVGSSIGYDRRANG
jgi:ornithine--oxo-acid transaminase